MADEVARRDDTGIPTLLGVGETSGEVRRVLATETGKVKIDATLTLSAPTAAVTVHGSPDGGATRPIIKTDFGGNLQVGGDVAHDNVDSGNPVKMGGRAAVGQVPPAVSANGDRTDIRATVLGALNVAASTPGADAVVMGGRDSGGVQKFQIVTDPPGNVRLRLLSVSIWNKQSAPPGPRFVRVYMGSSGDAASFTNTAFVTSLFDQESRKSHGLMEPDP